MLIVLALLLLFSPSYGARYCVYEVKKGDTLYSIARASGVSVKFLKKVNRGRIRNPNVLRVGQRLLVPCRALSVLANYCSYKVRRGDSVIGVSLKFGVPVSEILKVNNLRRGRPLREGEVLMLPCDRLLRWQMVSRAHLEGKRGLLPRRFRLGGLLFVSPVYSGVEVRVVDRRVDIPLGRGERVVASATGKVVYVERSIHSMGTLVILKHKRGYYTVYAGRGIRWRVRERQYVQRGWILGRALYPTVLRFEIMKGNSIISPWRFVEEAGR